MTEIVPPLEHPGFADIERETIVLKAVWDMIDGMVNFAIFEELPRTKDVMLMFKHESARSLFNIILTDFLTPPKPKLFDLPVARQGGSSSDYTILFQLRKVCENPILGFDTELISEPVEAFAEWLEGNIIVEDAWFPRLEFLCPEFKIQRMAGIKLCGNIAKHSFARLDDNARKMAQLFKDNGHPLEPKDAYALMADFEEWFNAYFFIGKSSIMAEFLNNIRWGIYEYLQPLFQEAIIPRHDQNFPGYTYRVPETIKDSLAYSMYWELVSDQNREPYFPRFNVPSWLKD